MPRKSYEELYTHYVQKYTQRQDKLAARGEVMYTPLKNFEDWRFVYEGTKNDLKREVKAGKIKSYNVERSIIDKQTYRYSARQGRANKAALEREFGEKVTLSEARNLSPLFLAQVSNDYTAVREDLIKNGRNWYDAVQEAKRFISRYYFNSD